MAKNGKPKAKKSRRSGSKGKGVTLAGGAAVLLIVRRCDVNWMKRGHPSYFVAGGKKYKLQMRSDA